MPVTWRVTQKLLTALGLWAGYTVTRFFEIQPYFFSTGYLTLFDNFVVLTPKVFCIDYQKPCNRVTV